MATTLEHQQLKGRSQTEQLICTHCLQPCEDELIKDEHGQFCCHGCQTAYQLINAQGLCDYYEIAERRQSLKGRTSDALLNQYKQLDDEAIARKLGLFIQASGQSVFKFYCPEINCASCIYLLNQLPDLANGVVMSRTSFTDRTVTVWFKPADIRLSEIAIVMAKIGYAPAINALSGQSDTSNERTSLPSRQLLGRLVIAGFVAGNTMMLSFPAYLGLDEALAQEFDWLFKSLSIALSLPLMLYCARPWFSNSWRDLKNGRLHVDVPIAVGILALFSRSLVDILSGSGTGFLDSLAGLVFLLLIGTWLQNRYMEGLSVAQKFESYLPLTTTVLNQDGSAAVKLVAELVKDDQISIKAGETLPADLHILTAEQAFIDNSFLTGEAELQPASKGDQALAGARLASGTLTGVVTAKPSESYLTSLWNASLSDTSQKEQDTTFTALFVRYFTVITLSLATAAWFYWGTDNLPMAWQSFTAVLMVACPCALTLALPFATSEAAQALAKAGLFVKDARVVERLAHIRQIAFDKTGTLTEPQQIRWFDQLGQQTKPDQDTRNLIAAAAKASTHPLLQAIADRLGEPDQLITLQEVVSIQGKGMTCQTLQHQYRIGSPAFLGHRLNHDAEQLKHQSVVGIERDGNFIGYFLIGQALKTGIDQMLKGISASYQINVLTGDHLAGASLVTETIQSDQIKVLANQQPADKLAFIKAAQDHQQPIMMVGDGINDGPAMRTANVGLAIVPRGKYFHPTADALTLADQLTALPKWLTFSKKTLNMVRIGLAVSLFYNALAYYWAITGFLTPVVAALFMPLSSLSVVALTVLLTKYQARQLLK